MKNQFARQHLVVVALAGIFSPFILPKVSFAQVPSTAEPGIIMRGLEEEKKAPSRLEDGVVIPRDEAEGKGLSAEKVFVLKTVVLDGTTAYRDEDLSSLYQDMLGKKVSFADLNAIAQRITKKYREDGYVFSRAILPPQKITDGVVHLSAVEGRIADVKIVGKFEDKNGLVAKFADKIKKSSVANTKEIERYLLLIDDLPGLTAKSFIKPSATKGGGDLIINVEEDRFEGSAGFDNRGSRYIGPYRGTLVGAFNSTFGLHDRTTFRGIAATQVRELTFGEITHEEQIGSEGGKIKARAAITSSKPGGNISAQEIEGDSRLFDLEGNYPLLRSRNHNVTLIGGLNVLNSETDVLGVQVAEDHVRSARAGVHFDFTDSLRGVTQLDATLTHGLDILDATSDGLGRSRANGEHAFLKGNLTGTRVQDLWDLWSLMLSATAQASQDPLLASEEFTVGGASFGRAYDSGEIAGDSGWAGVSELRYGGPINHEFFQSYQIYSFIDYGRVKNKQPAVGEAARDSLTSAGAGLRFNAEHALSGYIEVDHPMNQTVASENDQDYRVFFNLLKRF